jgi:hypothetical protein
METRSCSVIAIRAAGTPSFTTSHIFAAVCVYDPKLDGLDHAVEDPRREPAEDAIHVSAHGSGGRDHRLNPMRAAHPHHDSRYPWSFVRAG